MGVDVRMLWNCVATCTCQSEREREGPSLQFPCEALYTNFQPWAITHSAYTIYIEADEILRGLYHVTAARQLLYVPPLYAPIPILQSLEGEGGTGKDNLHTLMIHR